MDENEELPLVNNTNEESPLVSNPRDALRGSVMNTVMSISENSKFYIILKLIICFIKLAICTFIIIQFETSTEKPLLTFIYLIISVDTIDIICSLYYASTNLTERSQSAKRLFALFQNISSITYLTSQILGNVWYYTCDDCYEDAPELTILSLTLIILGYISICIPYIICCCFCLCLPILIISLAYSQMPGQTPASEEVINKLQAIKQSDSTITECVICLQKFSEHEELIVLNCDQNHIFHSNCLKRWLRINNSCPICRKRIE